MSDTKIIQHVDDVYVCPNEMINRHVYNRCLKQLVENDTRLYAVFKVINGLQQVSEYDENYQYENGDVVWFYSTANRMYLLRRVPKDTTDYSDSPQDAIDNTKEYLYGEPQFELYGWEDLNSGINLKKFGIYDKLARRVSNYIYTHQRDENLHPIGMLKGDESYVKGKLMLTDMSNIDTSRSSGFFPYNTFMMTEDDVILNGNYRVWDNGLVEMDIVYRFGYCGKDEESGYDILTCNNMQFSFVENIENQKYFNSTVDADIFNVQNSDEDNYSQIDNTMQMNRNNYVNTYFANIRFPQMYFQMNGIKRRITFENNHYMIFGSEILSQDRDLARGEIVNGANCITYGNQTTQGFTAIYVTYPDSEHFSEQHLKKNYNISNGGLVSNSFSCHVVGRWIYQ